MLIMIAVQDSAVSVLEWDTGVKGNKYMVDNPFLVRTPSTAVVDMQGYPIILPRCCWVGRTVGCRTYYLQVILSGYYLDG